MFAWKGYGDSEKDSEGLEGTILVLIG